MTILLSRFLHVAMVPVPVPGARLLRCWKQNTTRSRDTIPGSFGALVHGPTGHYFYGMLDAKLPGTKPMTVASKVAIDQVRCALFWQGMAGAAARGRGGGAGITRRTRDSSDETTQQERLLVTASCIRSMYRGTLLVRVYSAADGWGGHFLVCVMRVGCWYSEVRYACVRPTAVPCSHLTHTSVEVVGARTFQQYFGFFGDKAANDVKKMKKNSRPIFLRTHHVLRALLLHNTKSVGGGVVGQTKEVFTCLEFFWNIFWKMFWLTVVSRRFVCVCTGQVSTGG